MKIGLALLTSLFALAMAASQPASRAGVAADFDEALARSGYIHEPLRHMAGTSLESEAAAKPVEAAMPLQGRWSAHGELASLLDCDTTTLCVNYDTGERRAKGSPDDPDYAVYGHASASLALGGVSLADYNRLYILIEPQCPGIRVVNINLAFRNRHAAGEGFNAPTGSHLIQLKNGELNRCYLEIADLRRDCVDAISLSVSVNGRDLPIAEQALFRIHAVEAQRVAHTEKVSGWQPDEARISYSQTGYAAAGAKTAVCAASFVGKPFSLVNVDNNKTALRGKVAASHTTIGDFGVVDFSKVTTPGRYKLLVDKLATDTFSISCTDLWDSSCWRVLNFLFCQRCGYSVPDVHARCHTDLFCVHEGRRYPYSGGWHDAGDLSQQTLQSADVVYSLLELYDRCRESNPALAARLREEALWGLDFVLRCRLGDGYHASSMGLLLWQDGVVDSHDDITTVRKQNLPYDNFLYAAYEAYAARILDDGTDDALIEYLRRVACEDYEFAVQGFAEKGFDGWLTPWEHTYNTSESQFMATASWAASELFALTADETYAGAARRYADYVLNCQNTEPVGASGINGFFYRNSQRRSVVHFIHQSREQLFMTAMAALCRTQPGHADYGRWQRSIELYGDYIKSLMRYTAPYGMIPSGIYRTDEHLDTDAFFALHLFPPADADRQFQAQAAKGVAVAPGFFVKRFPVWFNIFNGNLAVHMSMGKAAGICANVLGDAELRNIAREQLYWTVGKNPFAQSLIYGEGARYPSLNNFSSGEIVGAMPVGIRSLGDSDEPYWPQINNACYKEVWTTSAGKWFSLVAETFEN